jgi:hypothetical protein
MQWFLVDYRPIHLRPSQSVRGKQTEYDAALHAPSLVLTDFCPFVTTNTPEAMNIQYLAHGVFRLYEDVSCAEDSEDRFYVNVLFSPGAAGDPFAAKNAAEHRLPIMLPVPLCGRVPFAEFKRIVHAMGSSAAAPGDSASGGGGGSASGGGGSPG